MKSYDLRRAEKVVATVSFPAGAERPIELIEVTIDGSTLAGVQSVSLLFDGNGGSIDGINVANRYVAEFSPNNNNDTVGSIPYTVPTAGAGRILISYVKET